MTSGEYDGKGFTIKTFNAFPLLDGHVWQINKSCLYMDATLPDVIIMMLRRYKLQLDDVLHCPRHSSYAEQGPITLRIKEMTERGIPVFQHPEQ